MSIGDRIRQVRTEKGLSQKEFADAIESSKSAVASYEKNQQTPGASVIAAICERFDVEPRWLLMGQEPIYIDRSSALGRNLNHHNQEVEATEARVIELSAELERIKAELLAANIERDRAKEDAYKAMKAALKAHGTDIDQE